MSTRTYPIVGAFYRPPAEALLAVLPIGAKLRLVPEDENQYDPNAIAVWLLQASLPEINDTLAASLASYGVTAEAYTELEDVHVGYLPRDVAAALRAEGMSAPVDAEFSVNPRGKPLVRFETLTAAH